MADKSPYKTIVSNRRARFEYHILETFTAGMVLKGTEVKSLRDGKANIHDAFCYILKGELFIKNMEIGHYEMGNIFNHEPKRDRKLLLKKKEIRKIKKELEQKGHTLIPLKIYFNDRNLAKIDLALGKGKKLYDKREDIKQKDTKREVERSMKHF